MQRWDAKIIATMKANSAYFKWSMLKLDLNETDAKKISYGDIWSAMLEIKNISKDMEKAVLQNY